jgi:hypothetical protein
MKLFPSQPALTQDFFSMLFPSYWLRWMDVCWSDMGRSGGDDDDGIDGPIKEDVLGRKVALSAVNNCRNTTYNGSRSRGCSIVGVEQPAVVD